MASLRPRQKMPKLTDGEAGVKCHCCPPGIWKNVARVSISDAMFILERGYVGGGGVIESTPACPLPRQRV